MKESAVSKAVGINIDGEVEWHAPGSGVSDYDSLCGIDANDPVIGHDGIVTAKRGQKITCAQCQTIWLGVMAMKLKASNFDVNN